LHPAGTRIGTCELEDSKMDKAAPPAAAADATLGEVAHHYGSAYLIRPGIGECIGLRRDGKGDPITAPRPAVLWDLLAADYAADPVPREFDPPSRDPLDVVPLAHRGAR
jgi:hypothetical protein